MVFLLLFDCLYIYEFEIIIVYKYGFKDYSVDIKIR